MQASLAELAQLVGGTVVGDDSVIVTGAAIVRDATPDEISFVDQVDKAHLLEKTRAAAAVVPSELQTAPLPVIHVADVHASFAAIVSFFRPPRTARRIGISPAAIVSPTARLGYDVDVHAGATIGDDVTIGGGSTVHCGARIMPGCRIGENVTIHPNAVLYENTVVGPHCVIHANAVLGGCGFGYRLVEGRHRLSAQLGYVEIGPHVDIGAGATIDRGTYGPTVIGEGTKIDNQVMVGHNCRIGRHNLLCSQVGIAGSTTTGDYVVMAGQVGVRDHVHISDKAVLCAKAGIMNDVPEGGVYVGSPAMPERDRMQLWAMERRLPEMRRQLKELRKTLDALAVPETQRDDPEDQQAAA